MKRANSRVLFRILALLAVAIGCASPSAPARAPGPIVWNALGQESVPSLVTSDEDGSQRVTKLWIVVVEGQGYIRTGNSRWFRNIERDPDVVLWIGGLAYPLRAETVREVDLRERIFRAFRKKYGFWDWLVHPFGSADSHVMRLAARGS